jgi:WhiB family redox-sensing transcriptional regulator
MSNLQLINPATWPTLTDEIPIDEIPYTEAEVWMAYAVCASTDPEAYFPEKGGSTREAKKTCLGCDVRRQCLEYALANDERFGVWGGLSERERRKLRKKTEPGAQEAADEPAAAEADAA